MTTTAIGYRVDGVITDEASGKPIPGLRVRAYDKDFFREQLLGDGHTDDTGRYEIRFDRDDFTGPLIRIERHPDIFLTVYDAEDRLIHTTRDSIVVDADRQTSIDLRIPFFPKPGSEPGVVDLFGIAVNLPEVAKLNAEEVLGAYRLMRGYEGVEQAERIKHAFPGLFTVSEAPPECGNGIPELFHYLMLERNALDVLADADADPYSGATVHQFFTANIVVNYTTDATLPGGAANPNQLPAGSATIPTADATYSMPNGTVIGTVRHLLADLNASNTEVAPTYIQKIGLLAEYSLSHYINAPFSYLDPRGGLTRLEFRILGLGTGVAGYAVGSDFHMELNTSNSDSQNLGTVPHELFHLVQYRYNATVGPAGGFRQSTVEGGARFIEESINETPNRYVESAVDPDLSSSPVPRKGIFTFPSETLLDVGGNSLLRYAAGLLWKYIAEQHSTRTGAADEPAIGVDAYRKIIEQMKTTASDFSVAAVRNGRGQLPWYGSFDQFGYYDAAATELDSHETTWAQLPAGELLPPPPDAGLARVRRAVRLHGGRGRGRQRRQARHVRAGDRGRQRDHDGPGQRGDEDRRRAQAVCRRLLRADAGDAGAADGPGQRHDVRRAERPDHPGRPDRRGQCARRYPPVRPLVLLEDDQHGRPHQGPRDRREQGARRRLHDPLRRGGRGDRRDDHPLEHGRRDRVRGRTPRAGRGPGCRRTSWSTRTTTSSTTRACSSARTTSSRCGCAIGATRTLRISRSASSTRRPRRI